ncbi:MAG TPA: MFS transporter [Anaeromyxobacter sp.]
MSGPRSSARRLDPALAAIVGEGLFSRLAFGILGFALPLYARRIGLSLAEIGVLLSLNSAVAIGLKPVLGFAADRFGAKRTLVVAVALRSMVSLLLVFASAPWQLFAIRSLHGVSMALRDPAASVLVAERGGKRGVASAFAWYQSAKTVAASLSKACAGVLLGLTSERYPVIFLIAFALSSLPLAVVLRFVHELPRAAPAAAAEPRPGEAAFPRAAWAPVLGVAGLGLLVAGTAEMLAGLFPVLATEYAGLSITQTGLVYAVATTVAVISGPVFGWLSDHVSRKLVLSFRAAANVASSLVYLAFPSFAGVGVARCVDDMGKAAFRPAWGALMAQVSEMDPRNRARTMSWLGMGEDAGGVLAPMLAGFLWSGWGIAVVLGARVALAAVSEVYAIAIARRLIPAPRPGHASAAFDAAPQPAGAARAEARPC